MYNIIYETSSQSRFDARYWMLGGWCTGTTQRDGTGREEGGGLRPDHAGESPLLSRSGGEKGLRGSGAGTLGALLPGCPRGPHSRIATWQLQTEARRARRGICTLRVRLPLVNLPRAERSLFSVPPQGRAGVFRLWAAGEGGKSLPVFLEMMVETGDSMWEGWKGALS